MHVEATEATVESRFSDFLQELLLPPNCIEVTLVTDLAMLHGWN